jgi:tetratricopeptide (TPR) repeat protein
LWYALLLAPVLGLAQSGPQLVAARYSYLACLPFAVAVAALAARIRFARGLAIAALLLLAGLTVRQCLLWRDTGTLFTHALTIEPGSGTAHFFAGCARERAGDFAAAEAHYRSAVAWWPQDVAALTNLGSVRARQGDWREAILWWQRALYARPEAARDARLNLEDARRAHPELFPPR